MILLEVEWIKTGISVIKKDKFALNVGNLDMSEKHVWLMKKKRFVIFVWEIMQLLGVNRKYALNVERLAMRKFSAV